MIKISSCLWILSLKVLLVSSGVIPHPRIKLLRQKNSDYFIKAPLHTRDASVPSIIYFDNTLIRRSSPRSSPTGPLMVFITNRNKPNKMNDSKKHNMADRSIYTEDRLRDRDVDDLRYYENKRDRKREMEADVLRNKEAKLVLRMLPDDEVLQLENAVIKDLVSDSYPIKQILRKDKALRDFGGLQQPRIFRFSDLVL